MGWELGIKDRGVALVYHPGDPEFSGVPAVKKQNQKICSAVLHKVFMFS